MSNTTDFKPDRTGATYTVHRVDSDGEVLGSETCPQVGWVVGVPGTEDGAVAVPGVRCDHSFEVITPVEAFGRDDGWGGKHDEAYYAASAVGVWAEAGHPTTPSKADLALAISEARRRVVALVVRGLAGQTYPDLAALHEAATARASEEWRAEGEGLPGWWPTTPEAFRDLARRSRGELGQLGVAVGKTQAGIEVREEDL